MRVLFKLTLMLMLCVLGGVAFIRYAYGCSWRVSFDIADQFWNMCWASWCIRRRQVETKSAGKRRVGLGSTRSATTAGATLIGCPLPSTARGKGRLR